MYGNGHAYSFASSSFGIPTNASFQSSFAGSMVQPVRTTAGFANEDRLSHNTNSTNPEDLKSRIFIGNLNTNLCSRADVIDLCHPYGKLKAVSLLKGYAFVQYENESEAEMAIKILSGYNFYNQKLDVRLAAIGKGSSISTISSTGPIRRPKHDFLFGGQRIRVDTTNNRNRTFAQDVFGVLKDVKFHNHGKDDTMICGSCRTVYNSIKLYIEHRREKKCSFFERDVAPSVISCFTCKEEFNEPWLFIQHLIHRHSINLYRGQPESDPITYLTKQKEGDPKQSANKESNGSENGRGQSVEPVIGQESVAETAESTSNEPALLNLDNTPMDSDLTQPTQPIVNVIDKPIKRSPTEYEEPVKEKEVDNVHSDEIPSYNSAVSIGVSSRVPINNLPPSTMFIPTVSVPSFHSQMSNVYRPQQPLMMPPYQSAPSITLPQFNAQSAAMSSQGGLSEEDQLKMLQEFENA